MKNARETLNELFPQFSDKAALEEGHLGGCAIEGDVATHYPIMWSYLIDFFKIKSVIDVGCGFGYSLDFFQNLGH